MDELAGTDWRREGESIGRDLEFGDSAAAMAYVNRLADLAEEVDHTDSDVQMAKKIDALG